MGLRVRKSINLGGGFRVNISSSGIGYSWGVRGFRITKTANGKVRRTYSIPGTGISYSTEAGSSQHVKSVSAAVKNVEDEGRESPYDYDDTKFSVIEDFQPTEYKNFLKHAQQAFIKQKILKWAIVFLIISGYPLKYKFIACIIAAILLFFFPVRVPVYYNFEDDNKAKKYQGVINAVLSLNQSKKLWQYDQLASTDNVKTHAGAKKMASFKDVSIKNKTPWYLKSNIKPATIKMKKQTLVFLPDRLLIQRGTKFGVVDYDELQFAVGPLSYGTDEKQPNDVKIECYRWIKINKDGSPDKRFKNNKQIPFYRYGAIKISSPSFLIANIVCSNFNVAEHFRAAILESGAVKV